MQKIFYLITLGLFFDEKDFDTRSWFLPCQHCSHECSIDAKSCPNCGTVIPFGIYSTYKLFALTAIIFFLGLIIFFSLDGLRNELLQNSFIAIFITVCFICAYLTGGRSRLLKRAAELRKYDPEKFSKIWK